MNGFSAQQIEQILSEFQKINKEIQINEQHHKTFISSETKKNNETVQEKFMNALISNDKDTMKLLLKKGLNPNFCDKETSYPLILAAVDNNIDLIELLLKNNADINIKDKKGFTALSVAIQEKKKDIVEVEMNNYTEQV